MKFRLEEVNAQKMMDGLREGNKNLTDMVGVLEKEMN
jgi:hypothetical protein